MNWLRENRFLGTFLIVLGVCTLCACLVPVQREERLE